jgi:putative transposase
VNDIQGGTGAGEADEEQEARLAREALAAEKRLTELVSPGAIDRMLGDAEAAGMALDGPGGLLAQMNKAVIERALGAELDDHLGYVKGDPAGNGSGNSRNSSYGKTVTTTAGPVRIAVPRDRNSTYEPKLVPKGQRRLGQVDDMLLSLYARGMTTRDIRAHLAGVYGAQVSPALISNVTDVVAEEITAWQTRPLDSSSSGRLHQSVISASTLSVILLIVSLETDAP